ncbi:calpain-8-like [Xenopus tropicalis]|uniref:Calpain 8 gene 5 n=1 Tax=Xenopus tropicalis TaxID=8364 RepID=A0A803JN11_XENTR|nr:calpain-8-like [Xenopus tropicalis]
MAQPEGTKQNPKKHLGQDYEQLRAQSLPPNPPFEDKEFPASQASLGSNKLGPESNTAKGIVWLRPSEIHPNPEFITSGATRFDICQQDLGDCWILSSMACLTLNEEYLSLVVPQDQSFKNNYAGIFHFRFWQRGDWTDVVVDDKLPTTDKKLVFVKSAQENEFWAALLEKAFAKLYGSYEAIWGKNPILAMEDLTGGVCESYSLKSAPGDLFQTIQRSVRTQCLLTCSTDKKKEGTEESSIVAGHSYSITGAEEVPYGKGKVQLIRLRNPWGSAEWKGAWRDDGPEWNDVTPEVKKALLNKMEDGEFWMPYADVVKEYNTVEICYVASSSGVNMKEPHWSLTQTGGSWNKGNPAETFLADPRFRFKLEVPDEDQAAAGDAALCTVIVALMQKTVPKDNILDFQLYELPKEVSAQVLVKDLKSIKDINANQRNSGKTKHFRVPKGEYLIVPKPSDPNQDIDFCIRVFSMKKGGAA